MVKQEVGKGGILQGASCLESAISGEGRSALLTPAEEEGVPDDKDVPGPGSPLASV